MKTLNIFRNFFYVLPTVTFACSQSPKNSSSSSGPTIDRQAVRTSVRQSLPAFASCFEAEHKKDRSLNGKVVLAWEIHDGGIAKNVRINVPKTTLRNENLEKCMINVMAKIVFPLPPKDTVAEVAGYPFVFNDENETLKSDD